jgi:hypothetical protein
MALQGSLRDFGVAEILQLIASQEKTGILTFTNKKESVSIGFESGRISGAVEERRGQENPLEQYLLASGRISREQLNQLATLRIEFGIPFEELIVREGYMSHDGLAQLIRFKIQEVIDNLLTWQEGSYKFTPGGTMYPASTIKVSLDAQAITLEGMRRIDEWPRIERALAGPHPVFARQSQPILTLELGAEEQTTLELIDGHTSIDDLIDRTGLGRFRTYQAVYNLVEVGAIKRIVEERQAPAAERTGGAAVRQLKIAAMAGIMSIFLAGLILLNLAAGPTIRTLLNPTHLSSSEASVFGRLGAAGNESEMREAMIRHRQQRVEHALNLYYLEYGAYPTELSLVVEAGLAGGLEVAGFGYRTSGDLTSCTLTPSGAE